MFDCFIYAKFTGASLCSSLRRTDGVCEHLGLT